MSSSSSRIDNQVYHEKENLTTCVKSLLIIKNNNLRVSCSRALLNCLVQREAFKTNFQATIGFDRMQHYFKLLKLDKYCKLSEIDQLICSDKGTMLGSILAVAEALSPLNTFLSPVDNMAYTSLVERPCGYICSLGKRLIILRIISGQWYLIDPGTSAQPISDTYKDMIIKQLLLLEKEPIFRVSGKEFSKINKGLSQVIKRESNGNRGGARGAATSSRTDFKVVQTDVKVDRSVTVRTQQSDDDHHSKLNNLQPRKNVEIGAPTSTRHLSRSVSRTEIRERCRSETRRIVVSSSMRSEASDRGPEYDPEWPPLEQERQRLTRRRAKSSPRSIDSNGNQYYRPPKVSGKVVSRKTSQNSFDKTDKKSEDKTGKGCCICLLTFPDFALYPCGHQCLCVQCTPSFLRKFTKCPICQQKFSDAIKIYKV